MRVCFTNLVWGIRQTATKLCLGSKKLHSTCSGNIHPVRQTLPLIGESKDSSPADEQEIKIKMDDGVDTSLASAEIDLFVYFWVAQPCLWDPE